MKSAFFVVLDTITYSYQKGVYHTLIFQFSSSHSGPLTSLVQSRTSNYVRVNIAKVERRQVRVIIRDSNEHSPVNSRVTLVSRHIRLDSLSVA